MNRLRRGFWDIIDEQLRCIGRGTVWLLLRRHSITDEGGFYTAIGGALVCAVCGGVAGFALSDSAQDMDAIVGTILGSLLGLCMGILFGSIVETVDSTIKDLLRSLNSTKHK